MVIRWRRVTVVEKILRSMTSINNFVVCSIIESKDIDELLSSLIVHEPGIIQQGNKEQALKASTEMHFAPTKGDKGQSRGQGRGR